MVFFFFFKQKTAYEIGVRLVGSEMCIRDRGIDDDGELGKLRVEKSYQMLNRTDLAIVVIDGGTGIKKEDFALLKEIEKRKVPFIIAVNKSDLLKEHRIQSKGLSLIHISEPTRRTPISYAVFCLKKKKNKKSKLIDGISQEATQALTNI